MFEGNVYKVVLPAGSTDKSVLVRAKTKAGAVNHVAKKYMSVVKPTPEEILEAGKEGRVIEDAIKE